VRLGRPPREYASEVEERILDAARLMFLERGLNGASMGEIARLARAGKTTIYARFPNKEALFVAVGMRNATKLTSRFDNDSLAGSTLEERLVNLAANFLKRFLVDDVIDFMRLSTTEVRHFPDLAKFGRLAREHGTQTIGQILAEIAASEPTAAFPAFAADRLAATTLFFVDLVVARFLLRAMFGEDLTHLRAEIDDHVARTVPFFLAACRGIEADCGSGPRARRHSD
jgi:AcrR family transcriptional regulator